MKVPAVLLKTVSLSLRLRSRVSEGQPLSSSYLLEAAFSLESRAQLLFLLHSHLHYLVQEPVLGLSGVQAAVQGLPQALQLGLQARLRKQSRTEALSR